MSETIEKYKINEILDNMTIKEYKFAMRTIPGILGISMNTFHNYRRIKLESSQDIPYEAVKQLEILFEVPSGGLQNAEITGKSLAELFKEALLEKEAPVKVDASV